MLCARISEKLQINQRSKSQLFYNNPLSDRRRASAPSGQRNSLCKDAKDHTRCPYFYPQPVRTPNPVSVARFSSSSRITTAAYRKLMLAHLSRPLGLKLRSLTSDPSRKVAAFVSMRSMSGVEPTLGFLGIELELPRGTYTAELKDQLLLQRYNSGGAPNHDSLAS